MGTAIQSISIEGFKSIRRLDELALGPLNVLIGANGAGKSNFVDFFRLLRAMADESLQGFVNKQGGADGFFYLGPKATPTIKAQLQYGRIVIDEPELGLHPHALEVLAGLVRKASVRTQVIVSTQSAPLLSQFDPADVIVVNRRAEASEFHRLDGGQLEAWLEQLENMGRP